MFAKVQYAERCKYQALDLYDYDFIQINIQIFWIDLKAVNIITQNNYSHKTNYYLATWTTD